MITLIKVLLPALRCCFDANKYIFSADGADADADARRGKDGGTFNAFMLQQDLRSPLFNRYLAFALAVDMAPSEHLGKWAEGCNCHESLLSELSEYNARQMFQNHYGVGIEVCPAAGKRSDLMAHGHYMNVLEEGWLMTRDEIFTGTSAEIHPLTQAELEILEKDVDAAQTHFGGRVEDKVPLLGQAALGAAWPRAPR